MGFYKALWLLCSTLDSRIGGLENSIFDVTNRLHKSVQLVRSSSFRNDSLQNPYFSRWWTASIVAHILKIQITSSIWRVFSSHTLCLHNFSKLFNLFFNLQPHLTQVFSLTDCTVFNPDRTGFFRKILFTFWKNWVALFIGVSVRLSTKVTKSHF